MIPEELTQKTLKSNDKIKVARVIATMLGVDNVEASANPEMIVNQGLRKIRSKALNPEALSVVGRMLQLASSLGIEYDNALVPSKLKEAVMQPNGTDKIETAGPVDLMRFKSYSGKVGHTLHHDETANADQVRKMKIKHQLGEKSNVEKEMLDVKHAREKESLAKKHEREKASVSEETDLNEDVYAKSEENKRSADAAKKQGDMFAHHLHMSDYHDNLAQWHSEKGRHGEADKHAAKSEDHHEKAMSLKEEVQLDEISAELAGRYFHKATQDQIKNKGLKRALSDKTSKRAVGKDRAMDRILKNEEVAEPTGDLKDACWKGYTAVGMKKKNGKMVPNCVPVKEEAVEESLKPGWMLKKDPVLAKRLKDAIKVSKARKASYGNPAAGVSAKPVNEDVCPECREEPCSCSGAGIQSPAFDPFFKESAVDVTDYEENWEEHLFATEEPTDEEIEHFMHHLSDNEIYELYDDDELALVDDETGEEVPEEEEEKSIDEQVLSEVLSRVERMKAKFRIRKTKAKRERATKIALRRHSNTKTINKRSRRLAIKLMKKRLLRGRDASKISVSEKERVERTIETRKKLIDRLAMRLSPRVRKIETSRLNHTKFTGASNVAV